LLLLLTGSGFNAVTFKLFVVEVDVIQFDVNDGLTKEVEGLTNEGRSDLSQQ
jgi:hypothetical protein